MGMVVLYIATQFVRHTKHMAYKAVTPGALLAFRKGFSRGRACLPVEQFMHEEQFYLAGHAAGLVDPSDSVQRAWEAYWAEISNA